MLCVKAKAQETPSAYQSAYAKWETLSYGQGSITQSIDAFDNLQSEWKRASPSERSHAAYHFALAAVNTAANAPIENANRILDVAAKVATEYPIVLSRGKSAKQFQRVASVHARAWGASKTDPFQGVSMGYEMSPHGSRFIALQEAPDLDQTVAVDANEILNDNEKLGILLDLDSSGSIVESVLVTLGEGSGSLRSRLKAILKHEPSGKEGPNRYSKHAVETFFAPQMNSNQTTQPPKQTREEYPQAQKTQSETTPTSAKLGAEIPSLTAWILKVVLVVAAICLLLLLKCRFRL